MQIAFNFKEMEQIILNHVQAKMGVKANNVEITSSYREDYCIVTHNESKVKQVSPKFEPVSPAMEDWP